MKRAVCVDEAVSVLMGCFGIDATEAETILRRWSADNHSSVVTVAHVLVHQVWRGDEPPSDRRLARAVEEQLRRLPGPADHR